MFFRFYSLLLLLALFIIADAQAQDSVRISFQDFIIQAVENSGKLKYDNTSIDLANNRVQEAKNQRFLPRLEFRSEHAVVPGVKSFSGYDESQLYLDPEARNDWEHIGVYTQLRISAVQPIFTWGAVNKAIAAAKEGAQAEQKGFEAKQADYEIKLYELYYSYVLALEIKRLLNDAEDKIAQIERALDKAQEDGDEDLDESDIFKFKVYKSQFGIQKAEVEASLEFVQQTWNYALRNSNGTIYEPAERFLDPVKVTLSSLDYYQTSAFINRPEIKALEFGRKALDSYINSLKAQNLPGLYLGITTTYASTPIRPKQRNPFINNPGNTFNTAIGFSIRQNLNFLQSKTALERNRIELRKTDFMEEAAQDGIILEVNNAYKDASLAEIKVAKTDEALVTTKEWLRMEQLDYDFGIGEVKDLIDAMKMELELRLKYIENVFEFNSSVTKLNKTAGLPLFRKE